MKWLKGWEFDELEGKSAATEKRNSYLSVAFYAAQRWLQGFAYRTSIGVGPFLIAGLLTLLTVLVSVVFQTLKAASSNPSDSLRYE